MEKLLVATDLSIRSDRALERSIDLARERSALLTVVHVVDEDLPASLADAQQQAAKQAIHDRVDALAKDGISRISVEVVSGRPYISILELSEKVEAELIVLGVHREELLKDMFRGTTVERVIRAGSTPTLLVNDPVNTPYRQVMVGIDFSVYSRRAVEYAVKFVPSGEFHLVHAYDVPFKGFLFGKDAQREADDQYQRQFQEMIQEELTALLTNLEGPAPKLESILEEGLAREVLHRQTSQLKPDLLVIGTHGRTGVANAFLGSVAEDMLQDPPCDVLAVKAW